MSLVDSAHVASALIIVRREHPKNVQSRFVSPNGPKPRKSIIAKAHDENVWLIDRTPERFPRPDMLAKFVHE